MMTDSWRRTVSACLCLCKRMGLERKEGLTIFELLVDEVDHGARRDRSLSAQVAASEEGR